MTEFSETPLPYMSTDARRMVVKAVGDFDPTVPCEAMLAQGLTPRCAQRLVASAGQTMDGLERSALQQPAPRAVQLEPDSSAQTVRPGEEHEWSLSALDVEHIAAGAAILGCGGGGSPYVNKMRARQLLAQGKRIRVVRAARLPADALAVPLGFLGSPAVLVRAAPRRSALRRPPSLTLALALVLQIEKIPAGTEVPRRAHRPACVTSGCAFAECGCCARAGDGGRAQSLRARAHRDRRLQRAGAAARGRRGAGRAHSCRDRVHMQYEGAPRSWTCPSSTPTAWAAPFRRSGWARRAAAAQRSSAPRLFDRSRGSARHRCTGRSSTAPR